MKNSPKVLLFCGGKKPTGMPDKKIIAIIGATGAQGGGLARAILHEEGAEGQFAVRAIVRNAHSHNAELLRKWGAEVVQADVNDEAALTKAVEGCYGMYCVTFFWEHMSPDEELQQARNMANAAQKNGIKHVVWSTLEDTRKLIPLESSVMPTLFEKYKVPHFDAKGEADHFFINAGVPTTFMVTTFYWDNLITFGMGPKKMPDGTFAIALPMGKKHLFGIASEDIGRCALGIFKRPDEYIGKRVGIAGESLTMQQMADKMSKKHGREIRYHEMTFDEYRNQNFSGAKELGNMFQYYHDCAAELAAIHDVEQSRKLNPKLMNFDQWLDKYEDRFSSIGE